MNREIDINNLLDTKSYIIEYDLENYSKYNDKINVK